MLLTIVAVAIVAVAAAGYWWMNRPPGPHKSDNSGLYRIQVNDKYGFMDRSGKMVITPQFDQSQEFSEGLAQVLMGNKWGYINTKGLVVITPQFDEANRFSEGRAPVKAGGQWGFIDKNGKYVSTPVYDYAQSFSEGLAQVHFPNGSGPNGTTGTAYVDHSGKVVIPANPNYSTGYGEFHDGLAPAAGNGKWGYIDLTGKWVIDPQFEQAMNFVDGLAAVEVGERWGYINQRGKFVVNPQYDQGDDFHEGYARVMSGAKHSFEGSARVVSGGKCGFIDMQGRAVVEAKFAGALHFSEGLAPVKTEEEWGFIDPTGKMVIDPQFDTADTFQNGLAHVTVLGKEAYITKTGAFVVDPFQGKTVKAIKEKMAAEAAQVRPKIIGCWMGQFGNMAFAQMVIGTDGSVLVKVPEGQGWREVLRGKLDPGTINPTLVGTYANATQTIKATLNFDESKQSLTGDIADANRGTVGRITLERCLD